MMKLERLYDVVCAGPSSSSLRSVRRASIRSSDHGLSAAYGVVGAQDLPIRESQPFRPLNLYAVSKIAQEMVAYSHHVIDLRVVVPGVQRNGSGNRPALAFGVRQQIAEIELGAVHRVLRTGNLSPQRDFVDVRDLARAYRLLAQRENLEVYNICSGRRCRS
jgi:GDP-4-dehydro-6-deoxy-D-mannose reductase